MSRYGDGVSSTEDAPLILRTVVHLIDLAPAQKAVADVNCDGIVSTADATLVLRKIVRLIASFPGCQ